jgi:trimethylamine--corrinoid protein Co-methyltransferase
MIEMPTNLKGGQLSFLSREDLEKIYDQSIRILKEIGLKSSSKEIARFFSDHGAEVNAGLIKIPESLVREALRKAPKAVTIYGRDSKNAITLGDKRIYFGLGGTPTPYILDYRTGEWRRPTKDDMIAATRLGDALPEMDFIMTIAGAFDVPYEVEYVHEWDAILRSTTKPVVYSAPGSFNAEKVIQMGKAIKGEALSKEPPFGVYVELPSPLIFDVANENVLRLAANRVPIVIGQMPQLGATAPVTIAGAASVSNAENLAVLTLVELMSPGTPFVFGAFAGPLDMRTARLAYGAPEFAMGNIITASLAGYYDLPTFGFGGCSDSKLPDAQAGAEVMMNSLTAALCGINLIHDCGYLAGGSIGSMEMAVIANEIAGMVKRIVKGIDVNDETLAYDAIREVGPGGHFLAHPHSLKHVSTLHLSDLFSRESEVKWAKVGKRDSRTKAKERVHQILSQPIIEDRDLNERLGEIVKRAEREVVEGKRG